MNRVRLSRSLWLPAFIAVALVSPLLFFSLTSCGGPQKPASNVAGSEEDAKRLLEARLKKTEEVKVSIQALRDAVRPIETLIADIEKALNSQVSVNGKPIHKIQTHLDAMQSLLKDSAEGLVTINDDGSWFLNRKLELPLASNQYKCEQAKLTILGFRKAEKEQMIVKVSDCAAEPAEHPILTAVVHSGGLLDMTFYLENVSRLYWSEVKSEQCSGSVEKGKTEIHCKPVQINGNSFEALIDPLDFLSQNGNIDAHFKVVVRKLNKDLIAEAELEAHPGMPTKISIKTK